MQNRDPRFGVARAVYTRTSLGPLVLTVLSGPRTGKSPMIRHKDQSGTHQGFVALTVGVVLV